MVIRDYEIPRPKEAPKPWAQWTLMFDGASNSLGHGTEAFFTSPKNYYKPFTARLCFDYTNNIAEYEACIMGLEEAIDLRIKFLEVLYTKSMVIGTL